MNVMKNHFKISSCATLLHTIFFATSNDPQRCGSICVLNIIRNCSYSIGVDSGQMCKETFIELIAKTSEIYEHINYGFFPVVFKRNFVTSRNLYERKKETKNARVSLAPALPLESCLIALLKHFSRSARNKKSFSLSHWERILRN